MTKKQNSIETLLKIIEEIIPNENGCKIWPMGINTQGYGNYSIKDFTYTVPRLIFKTLRNKEFKDELVVRHKCDIRSCCNVDHLEIGTQKDNIMDASKRGRLRTGEQNNKSIFTKEQVENIRSNYPQKTSCDLAKEYGTSASVICNIISGKSWKHIEGSKSLITYNRARGEKVGRSKLTSEKVLEIRNKYPDISGPALAKEYGVGVAMIYCIVKRKNWTHI